jgi:hypothetical protein
MRHWDILLLADFQIEEIVQHVAAGVTTDLDWSRRVRITFTFTDRLMPQGSNCTNAPIACLTLLGKFGHASSTARNSTSSTDETRLVASPECSAFTARASSQLMQVQTQSSLGSVLAAGYSPARIKGDNVIKFCQRLSEENRCQTLLALDAA